MLYFAGMAFFRDRFRDPRAISLLGILIVPQLALGCLSTSPSSANPSQVVEQARLLLEQGEGEKAASVIRHTRKLDSQDPGAADALRALIEDARAAVRTAASGPQADGARILLCTARYRLRDEPPLVEGSWPASEEGTVGDPNPRLTSPKKLYGPTPRMPEAVRQYRYGTDVVTQMIIDKEGCVTRIRPVEDEDSGMDRVYGLVELTVETISSWVFRPALFDGEPVAVYHNTTTSFMFQ